MSVKIDDSKLAKPFIVPLCLVCERVDNPEEPTTCEAFPTGIPQEILTGSFVHTEPFDGDNGLVFAPYTYKGDK